MIAPAIIQSAGEYVEWLRQTVQRRYELNDICLPGQVAMLEGLVGRNLGLPRKSLEIDYELA